MSSPSSSSLSSPRPLRYVTVRSDKTLRSTPRSLRTSTGRYQHHPRDQTSSQSGFKGRAIDVEEARCLSHRPSRKCLKCQRDGHDSTAGLFPIQSGLNISSSRLQVRSRGHDSGSPCSSYNEAPQVDSETSKQTARSQTHHRPDHQPFDPKHTYRRLASEKLAQVPALASPAPPVFPLPPSSLSYSSVPSTPPQHPRALRNRPFHASKGSVSSFASASPSPLSRRILPPTSGYSTPSPSPRSRKSRSISFVSSSLRPSTVSFLIKDGCPPRAPATLAMSMQIHAPSPIMSVRPTSPPTNTHPHSQSRPSSPSPLNPSSPLSRPPMARPPSRSERLLRDTLRRAEEHERLMSLASLPTPATFGATQPAHGFFSPSPSGGHRVRRNTASSTGTDASLDAFTYCDTGVCCSDEEEQDEADSKRWLWRTPSTSSSSSAHGQTHGYHHQNRPQGIPRNHGDDLEKQPATWRARAHSDVVNGVHADPSQSAYSSPASPSSARMQLQRSARSASNATRPSLPRAAHARSSRNSYDGDRPCACSPGSVFTPHEAVLRSRLEGVLRGAQEHERRRSLELSGGSVSSNSLASSRNMSGEGESFFAAAGESSMPFSPASNTSELPGSRARTSTAPANMYSHRRSLTSAQIARSPKSSTQPFDAHDVEPITPPPSPPFNAVVASEQCKAMEGYVSFATVAGLGMPDGEDEEEEPEVVSQSRWLKWFPIGTRRGESAVASR